jgi:KDO2-lipid IV(A) lauroyltransferase
MTFVPITEHAGSMDPLDITQKYFNLLEADIKAQPWNYLWTHRRWKKE